MLVFYVDGTWDGNAIVLSTGLKLFTMIQQMMTLHQPTKTTNPNPKSYPNTLTLALTLTKP